MKIVILNGSPRPNGNTVAGIKAFMDGAEKGGHSIAQFDVYKMNIKGCLACEYCHANGKGVCAQKDDMTEIYEALQDAELLVLASPVYYFGFSGPLQSAITRLYALGYPPKLKKSMLILSSGSENVYDGIIYAYKSSMEYIHVQDIGIYTYAEASPSREPFLTQLKQAGENLNA